MKRLIALLLALILVFCGLVNAIADEQPEENLTAAPEEVLKEEAVNEEEPGEQPVEEPAAEPEDEPAEQPAEEPAEQPAEELAEQPAEEPAEEPAEQPAEEPAEQPAEEPAEEPAEQPAEEPAEQPAEEPAEQPAEEPAEQPAEEPAEEPAEKPADQPAEEPEEEFKPDRVMNVGEEADGTLPAGKNYVIRLQGISGDIWIEAEASFALKMVITDEVNGQVQAFNGSGDAPLAASLKGQAGRTYLIAVGAENGFAAGNFHIQISRAEEPVAEEAQKPEEKDNKGALADNSAPKTAAAAALKVPTIRKITQKDDSVTITWTAVSGAKKYRVYCKKGSGSWKLLATLNGKNKTSYTHKTKVTASTSGNKFQYRICAIGAGSVKSKYAAQTIVRLAAPAKVTVKKHSTEDVAVVTWQKVKGATKYYVYYRRSGESSYKVRKVSASKTKTTVPVTGTMENQIYVTAVATGGSRGGRSAIRKITPYWYRVLLVGECDYRNGIKDLPGVRYDVSGMRDLFLRQTNSVRTMTDASASTILAGIGSAFGSASPNTVCVFMFSGHGSTGYGRSSGALVCSDGSVITAATLRSTMDRLKVNNIVILLGSCGSGGFISSTETNRQDGSLSPDAFNSAFISAFRTSVPTAGEFRAKGYTVITGAAAHEKGFCCWWTNRYNQIVNGGTDIMIALAKAGGYEYCDNGGYNAGFGSKRGDSNKDKLVTVKEAYTYAKKQVTRSHVQFWSSRPELILFQ